MDLVKKEVMLNLNCHHIGTIELYNPLLQTASISINYTKTFFLPNKLTGTYGPTFIDYPINVNCPVILLGGGSSALTFPISSGDECLVLFNDRDFDNWYIGGSGSPPNTSRMHSYTDAVALVGLRSLANTLLDVSLTHAELRNGPLGTTKVGVGSSTINIANLENSLGGLIQSLITEIKTLVAQTAAITVTVAVAPGISTIPINAAAITAVTTTLTALAVEFEALLE